jgi:hypothetical protein
LYKGSLLSTPSSVTLAWSARAPLTAPLRLSWSPNVLVGTKTAPGCRLSRPTTLRASRGRARTCVPLITLPMLASVVLITVVSAVTCTVSLIVPISSLTSCLATVSTARGTFSTIEVRNPCSSTFSV